LVRGATLERPAGRVAAAVCDVALAAPLDGTVEIGGPEPLRFEDFVREGLRTVGDRRTVVADPRARYFGGRLSERTLVPGNGARLAATPYDDWLRQRAQGS
jgi:hypothetical protein